MKRILLVDDESRMLELLKIALSDEGHAIETALSGEDGARLITRGRFDLVVTDFNMPGMKGDELAELSKQRWPETPVVMLTGAAEMLRRSKQRLAGVDLLLDKSMNILEFCRTIALCLHDGVNVRNVSLQPT